MLSHLNAEAALYKPAVTFTSSSTHKDQVYSAIFIEMEQTSNPKSRSYNVTLTMDNPKGANVVSGMTTNVKIDLGQVLGGLNEYAFVPV
ncbi:efflux RND transporter periplasmic adaptor subunit [Thalassotalea eurytherma]|uniref:Uncharacterized protein n=1 Tax=Thalassotalea eurytherma TaxID=1144278 RepID=A0ABQ6H575_9GAMM|nr:hypothetical protein [Thalassotalea eurytherma]GLX81977.1 hypothetical protein theurythT_14290 [Thalassotalea eurytherma]